MTEEEDSDKPHEPTQKRLDDARREGQIARSQDLLTAAAYAGFLLAVLAFGPSALQGAATAGMAFLSRPQADATHAAALAMLAAALNYRATGACPLPPSPGISVARVAIDGESIKTTGRSEAVEFMRSMRDMTPPPRAGEP